MFNQKKTREIFFNQSISLELYREIGGLQVIM